MVLSGTGNDGTLGVDEDMRKSRDAGIDEHLVKPVDPDSLFREKAGRRALCS